MSSFQSTIYGPVKSWRFGQSLGVDLLFHSSICSFNCIYCQLGNIQNITAEKKVYIETEKVLADFDLFLEEKKDFDVITFSGNGEPTLASNLLEVSEGIRQRAPKAEQIILTNGTLLKYPEVRKALLGLEKVIIKLDAGDEQTYERINRPAAGVTLGSVIEGAQAFRKEYSGSIEVQTMVMPTNIETIEKVIPLLSLIGADGVQINKPKRPYPLDWEFESRGNHSGVYGVKTVNLSQVDDERIHSFTNKVKEDFSGRVIER